MMTHRWALPLLLVCALLMAACGAPTQPAAQEEPSPTAAQEGPTQPAAQEEPSATPAQAETTGTTAELATPAEADGAAGLLRVGWRTGPDVLNPGSAVLAEENALFELVYDSMYQLELDGNFSNELAERVEVSADQRVWTFTIHDGVTFHDGEPLTAEDVAFSYNLYRNPDAFPLSAAGMDFIEDVQATDERTVELTLVEPVANLEGKLFKLYILPQHIWSELADAQVEEFENNPIIGSGPFSMVEFRQGEFVRLDANKGHYLYPPKIDGMVLQAFDNADARVQALRTGQVDMITDMPNTVVPTLRNEENIELVVGSPLLPAVRDIIINQLAPENCPPLEEEEPAAEEAAAEEGAEETATPAETATPEEAATPADTSRCTGHPALRDRTVRLALAHAVDKQKMIDVALLGLGTPGTTLLPEGMGHWYNTTLEDYAFDIAEANRLLDEAGYADTDGDGIREMPDGSRPLTFRLFWDQGITEAPRLAELLDETWNQIGVSLEPQAMDGGALFAACCPTFDTDIFIWGYAFSNPDPNNPLSVMQTEGIAIANSETGYANPEFDRLYEEQEKETDLDRRRELVWQMQEIIHRDVVYIIPYYQQAVQAYRSDRFMGWVTNTQKVALQDVSSLTAIEPVE